MDRSNILDMSQVEILVIFQNDGKIRIHSDRNSAEIRRQLEELLQALRPLTTPPPPRKAPIGSH